MLSLELKHKVHAACESKVDDQLIALQTALNQAKEALESETKSSAGDKHETGRAMAQLEMEKLGSQYKSALIQKQLLSRLKPNSSFARIQAGSLVLIGDVIYYLGLGLGPIEIPELSKEVYAISPSAPLGQLLLLKQKNQEFSFKGENRRIDDCI